MLASKLGADCSLDESPEKVKANMELPNPELLVVDDVLALGDARKSIQGTATCLPPASDEDPELLLGVVEEVESSPLELPELELVPLVPDVPPPPVLLVVPRLLELLAEPPLSEITAKSTLPDVGLIRTSLTVPIESPAEPVICAPLSWLARISPWDPILPVRLC